MKGEDVFAVINDGVYAGNSDGKYLYLTLLRGTGYCFHPIYERPLYPTDRFLPRIECGRYVYNLRIFSGNIYEVTKAGEEFASLPYATNIFPIGMGKRVEKKITVSGEVIIAAIKEGETEDYVIRLYNPKDEPVTFDILIGDDKFSSTIGKRAIHTVGYTGGKFTEYADKTPV